ncbi:MAG: sulfatase-like hydrolase/transferase [Bacteroidota bacterium]
MLTLEIKNPSLGLLLPLIFLCTIGCQSQMEVVQKKPNIIWLVAEDLSPRFDFYGDTLAHTPNLSGLASKSIIFDQAFTVSGVCAPSRSSIITGCYPTSIGTQHMRQQPSVIPMPGFPRYNAVPPPEVKAFPELLRVEGYWTASYRKLDYQFGKPFTIWDEVSDEPHWRNRTSEDEDKPFFLYRTYEITHEINIWPDSTKSRFFKEFGVDLSQQAPDVIKRPPFDPIHKVGPAMVEVPPYLPDNEISRDHIARLYDNMSRMDVQVGNLLADLKEDGLLENTIIFIMSDHGDCLPRGKRWIYDSGIHSPLAIYIPPNYLPEGISQTGRTQDLISYIDLAPTVLEFAGVPVPGWMHGEPIFSELAENPRSYIFAARDRMDNRYDSRRAIRNQRYKYIYNYSPEKPYQQQITFLEQMPLMWDILRLKKEGKLAEVQSSWLTNQKPREELYDLQEDPFELNNLAMNPAYNEIKTTLQRDLQKWQKQFGDLEDLDENIQAEQMWPRGKQPQTARANVFLVDGKVVINCPTEGASIAYKTSTSDRWEIYTKPIPYEGSITIKTQRYGYKVSEEVEFSQ